MEEHKGNKPRLGDTSAGNKLSQEVAARSDQRRRTSSVWDLFGLLGTIISGLAAAVSFIIIFTSLIPSSYLAIIGVVVGVVGAVISSIIALWFSVRRTRRPRKFYTNEREIRDDNLRELISGIAKGQIAFERRLTAANTSSLPKS